MLTSLTAGPFTCRTWLAWPAARLRPAEDAGGVADPDRAHRQDPLALLTPRRAAGHGPGAGEPPGRLAGSRPCRQIRSPRCIASSTLARGEMPRYGRRRDPGDQRAGTGASADTLRTSGLGCGWFLRRRYELALRSASLESARAGGIFRRRAGTKVPSVRWKDLAGTLGPRSGSRVIAAPGLRYLRSPADAPRSGTARDHRSWSAARAMRAGPGAGQ